MTFAERWSLVCSHVSRHRLLQAGGVARHWPLVLVLVPALWVAAPLWNETPLSYDHSAHLFKAWHFWTEMLGRGRLRGWSHFWAFGFPSDELVPFGEELWVVLFRVLTFGQLSWTRTYALAFGAFVLLKPIAAYVFTRRYFGTGAAVACAWITLFEPGQMLEGGWTWQTYWGVWPVSLAMCFVLFAYHRLEAVLTSGKARAVFWAGIWFGVGLLSHQMALLVFVITAPWFFLDHFLRPENAGAAAASPPGQILPRAATRFALGAGALGFGFALAAFSIVPFIARSHNAQDLGWLGDSLELTSQHLVQLQTFENVWIPVHGLALIGAWFGVRARRPGAIFMVCSGAVLVLLSSDLLVTHLHLERALMTLLKIENDRMLLAAKLFWFPLAGHGLVELARWPAAAVKQLPLGRRALAWSVALVLGFALVAPGARQFYETQIAKDYRGERETEFWDDMQAFLRWSNGIERRPNEVMRIAYHMWRGNHLSTLSPVFNGTPMYKVGYTPTQIFNKFPMTDETALFRALSVKYVVSSYPLKRFDLDLDRRFGRLWVYRFNRYDARPFDVIGPGQGELLEFEPERIRIRLQGTAPTTRVALHVANYDRWQARLGDELLPIANSPVFGVEYPVLMEVPGGDGELVFEYVYRPAEWFGLLISLAALPAFAGVLWLGRRSSIWDRGFDVLARSGRPLAWAALALLMLPADSIFQRLEGPELSVAGQPCRKRAPLSFQCGADRLQPEIVPGAWGIHSCMTLPDKKDLQIQATLPLGSYLLGQYDPSKEGAGSIRLTIDGQPIGLVNTRPSYLRQQSIQFDTRATAGKSSTVELLVTGAALHCFDFRLLP
jgi:hypothetical protein